MYVYLSLEYPNPTVKVSRVLDTRDHEGHEDHRCSIFFDVLAVEVSRVLAQTLCRFHANYTATWDLYLFSHPRFHT